MRKKAKHRFLYSFIGLAFVLLGVLFYFFFIPNPYLTPFLIGWINKQGWGVFDVEEIALHPQTIHLKNVKYTSTPEIPPLTMGSTELKISWDNFSPKIQEVILKNLLISKETIEAMGKASSTSAYPLPPLTFEKAIINSENPSFPFTLSFDGKFIPATSFEGNFYFTFAEGTLQGTAKAILAPSPIKADFSNLSLNLKGWKHLPLQGQGTLIIENDTLKSTISGLNPHLKFETQCTYNLSDQKGKCLLTYASDELAKIISPALLQPYGFQDFSGNLAGSATLTIKNGIVEPIHGKANFSHLSFSHPHIHVKDLSTSLRYSFDKILSFPKQEMKVLMDSADMGIPLSNLSFRFSWDGETHYHLHEGTAFLENGEITTKNVIISLPFKKVSIPLNLKNIPAQFFVTLSHVPNLKVSGQVSGYLDLEFTEQDYGIKKGSSLFIKDSSGKIQYRPGVKPKQISSLTGDENPMDLVFLALWNFKYEKLSLDLEKPLQGQLQATLHLKGKNPKLFKGHPFEFNIKAFGQLKELIENVFQSIKKP